jgi:CRISPR/Cas system CSM-associated protein Csm5 (group 7 of RAMP superfamily)
MEFINTYNLKLTTKSPLFIGDGRVINRDDYKDAEKLGLRLPPDGKRILEQYQHGKDKVHNISAFIRNGNGDAYLPASSVKGAVRTAILAALVKDRQDETQVDSALNTVQFGSEKYSIMRAISISDSSPIGDEHMTICQKIDVHTDGDEKKLPIYRECIKPGVTINMRLSIDLHMFKTITDKAPDEFIAETLRYFQAQYYRVFRSKFKCSTQNFADSNIIYMGGNVGFVSKTVNYPLWGETGLHKVAKVMEDKFRKHKHNLDVEKGVSPHCLKCTKYKDKLYEFGMCEVDIIDEG